MSLQSDSISWIICCGCFKCSEEGKNRVQCIFNTWILKILQYNPCPCWGYSNIERCVSAAVDEAGSMRDSTAALLIQGNNSATSGTENDPPSISNHSLCGMWSQLFDHYRDAHSRVETKLSRGQMETLSSVLGQPWNNSWWSDSAAINRCISEAH